MPTVTHIALKKLAPKDKPYKQFFGGGLYVQVKPTGAKHCYYAYRHNGKPQTLSLGAFPETPLADILEAHRQARKLVKASQNPSAERKSKKLQAAYSAATTFQSVAELWLENRQHGWTPGHTQKIRRRLEMHVYPHIGHRPVSDIKPLEMMRILKKVEERGTELAQRTLQYCRSVFTYGILTEKLMVNPCAAFKGVLKAHVTNHFPTISIDELPRFLTALENDGAHKQLKLAMRFLMMTMVRTGELRKAKWDDIDWNAYIWRIPAEHMKMRLPHIVPLSGPALAVLVELKELTFGNPTGLILPSLNRQKNPGMSENTLNLVIKRMGYGGRQVSHAFRALASTHLNESGRFRYDAIERQLAHVQKNAVRASYNHAEYLEERTQMLEYWGALIEGKRISNVRYGQFKTNR